VKIVMSGYYGFDNVGDEAILFSIIQALREADPTIGITVLSNQPEKTASTYGVEAVNRWDLKQINNVLKQCDGLISGGGSLLQDATGLKSIPYYAGIMKIAQWFKKPVFVYAQGMGPINKGLSRKIVKHVLKKTRITVRDQASKSLLQEIGLKNDIEIVPDPVLGITLKEHQSGWWNTQSFQNPVITVSVRDWPSNVDVASWDVLNVRSGPGTAHSVAGSYKPGTAVTIYNYQGDWALVSNGSVTGYVNSYYLADPNVSKAPTPGKTITIDPGHGGHDPGAVGNGLQEKEINLSIALKVQKILEQKGINVVMTRTNDTYLSLSERVDVAVRKNSDTFVSIHTNSAAATSASGTETYFSSAALNSRSADSKQLATFIQKRLYPALGTKDRKVKDAGFQVIKKNPLPAVLVELGFISNSSDASKLGSDYYRNKAPVSPIKIFAGLKLKIRKPNVLAKRIDPIITTNGLGIKIAIMEMVINAMEETPAAKPSNPSIKLIAFVIPTIHKIVIGILRKPNSNTPLEKGKLINST